MSNQTFAVQVEVKLKACFETLKLVSRYFNPSRSQKTPPLATDMSQQIWFYFQRAQHYIKIEVFDVCKNNVGKTVGRKLGIHFNPKA